MELSKLYDKFLRLENTDSARMAFCDWLEDNNIDIPELKFATKDGNYNYFTIRNAILNHWSRLGIIDNVTS